jgi:phosphatidylglycerophosphate synthase
MADPWVLVLAAPSGDPRRRVGGLPLALRLALDAQAAGASAVVVGQGAEAARDVLGDARLRLPVLDSQPPGVHSVSAPAGLLVHRAAFNKLAGADHDLASLTLPVDVPYGFDPIEVVDGASARRAERALFRSLRKPQDGWTSRWLNRPISLALSRLLVRTPLRPNQISIAILAVGLIGAWMASRGGYWSVVAGAALFHAQSVLDGCDGEMSRVTHRGSLLGEWLDTVGDDVTNYAFFAGAASGLYATGGQLSHLVAGAIIVGSGMLASGIEYRYLVRIGSGDLLKYPLSRPELGSDTGLFKAIQPLFKRDTFVLLTLLAAVLGLMGPMLYVFAAASLGILASVMAAELRMARERRARSGGAA